ncbi:MAG TPA: APC family permease [Verrucomicrobiae bacterium]|nr:APC family permease [Verrucomicrobiae bacterium]
MAETKPTAPDAPSLPGEQSASAPRLRRVLGLWDLVFYGIVLIQPVAATGPFGVANQMSRGHVVATILIAMVAMLFTAVSYGRMAALYPSAGSAYTYVGRALNPHLGFITGWAMFLDYLVIPILNVVYGALSLQRLIPVIPFWALVVFFAGVMTFLNLRGIQWTARANEIMLAIMCVVMGIFLVEATVYLVRHHGWAGLFSTEAFYNPRTFNFKAVCAATSFAALTYIGFDGITTLAEDVREPKRTVPMATVLVCLFTGIFGGLQVYLAHLVWPDYNSYPNVDTAFFDVCARVGGPFLFNAMAWILAIACLGSGLSGQAGAARILFGMGRDQALPAKFFARLDRRNSPYLNIWLIGLVALAGAFSLNYERAGQLLNFGAFLAFMGVNISVIRSFYFSKDPAHRRRLFADLVSPALGFLLCLGIWLSLPNPAKIVGGIWCAAGILYTSIQTRGFTKTPKMIDLTGA